MRKRPLKPRNYVGDHKIIIKKHVVDRYMERVGVSYEEARSTLVKKFRNSKLSHIKRDGSEVRSEVCASMDKRLTFIAQKKGGVFIVITCYLQGKKDNWWKNEGLVIDEPVDRSVIEAKITEELLNEFQEVIG